MSLFIITMAIKVDLFSSLALVTFMILFGAIAMDKYSETRSGQAFVARNLNNAKSNVVGVNDAPLVLKAAIDSWKFVLILPFRAVNNVYNVIRSHITTAKVTTKDIPSKLATQKI